VVIDQPVMKVTAEGEGGSFGLLPHHVDWIAALVPGILSFELGTGEEIFVAIDEGILVKQGTMVWVSVRNKVQARQEGDRSIWAGLGLFGMVGWSVIIPTLLGIALGIWIDKRFPSPYSWTLMLLFVSVVLGCWNAWYWIQKEQRR
jgi:ATP synthase protein I